MATKNNPGKFDCYEAAEDDEPMFVLLARDRHAPALVWLWATLRELDGEDAEKVTEAQMCAAAMMRWAYEHNRSAVGLAQPMLAGAMELIRAANLGVKSAPNTGTDVEVLRRFLCSTNIDSAPAPEGV